MFILALFSLLSLSYCSLINTPYGELEGFQYLTETDIPVHVFLGVRYGQAPIDDKRFEKADMVEKWAPELYEAKKFKPGCYPYIDLYMFGEQSEDCLYLNIITPTLKGDNLPVFVFIHGGAFETGSTVEYGYKKVADAFASQGIIVVTIQYRLGPLGFFSLGDSSSPGNIGLWDQTLALQFLHKILPSFGADLNRITVSGLSAGACSTSALQLSPHSNKLFQQGYLMSGSALTEFALTDSVVETSKKLAKELNCLKELDNVSTMDCLRNVPVRELLAGVTKIGTARRHPNPFIFQPRIDGDFFPDTIQNLFKNAPKQKTVEGATEMESALFVFYQEVGIMAALNVAQDEWNTFSRERLIDFIENIVVTDEEHKEAAPAFRKLLVDFYAKKDDNGGDSNIYLARYAELLSDLQFLMPLYNEVQLKLENDWPTWMYIIEHHHKHNNRSHHPVRASYHADDLPHISDMSESFFFPSKLDEEDKEFGENIAKAIVSFVKYGDPSFDEFEWPRVSKNDPFVHAVIKTKNYLRSEFRGDAARLWLEEVPSVVPVEYLRRSRLPGIRDRQVHTEL